VRFHDQRDIRVEDVPGPDAKLGAKDVLLRPRLCGICGTDLHEYLDGPIETTREPHPLTGAHLPQIMGHEFSAEVEAVGAAVGAVAPGDRVAVMPLIFCGRCECCKRGLPQSCVRVGCVGTNWAWGGMAELAVVEEHQVARLPDGVSYEQGALIEPAAVAVNAVGRGGVQVGDSILVTGAGPIGALCVLAARAAGASQVFLSEPNAHRAARAASLGANEIFDPLAVDLCAELRERTGGRGVDVSIECSGNGAALQACLQATRTRGSVAQVGLHVRPASIDMWDLAIRDVNLVGVNAFAVHDFSRVPTLVETGALPVEKVVTSKVALEDAVSDGFEALVDPDGDQIKILIATNG
jgi:(R,R)-butanediol dehydrogenase / meso-butanediol dehydrogenase / diacetyl reductase